MDRTVKAAEVRSLSGKEKRLRQWFREFLEGVSSADNRIAVSSTTNIPKA